jgi:hypothetical protein
MAKTDVTAINAKTISVNGVPVAGSAAPSGPLTTFDQINAATVLALNGTVLQGALPAGAIFTNYDNLNVTSGVSINGVIRYGQASGGGGPTIVNLTAYGVTDWDPGISFLRAGYGQYAPAKEYADLLADFRAATTVQTYYVDSVNGLDANNGATTTPWQRVHTAWTQSPAAATIEIVVRPPASRILWGPRGMTNASTATKNIILRAEDGGELIVAGGTLTTAPTWTDNGDGTFTCSSGVTNATVSPPVDWSPQARTETPDGDGRFFAQTITAAALDAAGRAALLPGQAHKNSTSGTNDLTIRPFGNRAASVWRDYVVPGMQPGSNMRIALFDATADSLVFFIARVKPSGGTPWSISNQRTTAGGRGKVYMDRCGAVGSTGTQNALAVVGSWLVTHFDSQFDATGADAINGHTSTNGNAAWLSGAAYIVSVRPRTATVGLSGLGVDNSDTSHETCRSLTVMPYFRGGNGRTHAFIDSSKGLVLGGYIGPSTRTGTYFESVNTGGTAQSVIVEATIGASPGAADITADTGSSVKCYGMTQGALRTSGDVSFLPLVA